MKNAEKVVLFLKEQIVVLEFRAFFLQFEGETRKVKQKMKQIYLYTLAHNVSGFDSYVVLKNLPQWRTVVSSIRNGSSFVSLKIFNGYIDGNKKIPQYVLFRCGRVHIIISLKKDRFVKNYNQVYLNKN